MRDYYDRAGLGKCHLDVMPLTYRISIDIAVQPNVNMNSGFQSFRDAFEQSRTLTGQSIWIVKPGENSNRGRGIEIFKDLEAIKDFVETCSRENEPEKTKFVIQKYIANPLLVEKRKFDLRVFGVASIMGGNEFRGYFYREGYLRTSSREYDIKDIGNRYVHLTNDAIQKKSSDYGKFETGNKISYDDFQELLVAGR
jgi:tubulin--tyrosine ligase